MKRHPTPSIGDTFGLWTVIGHEERDGNLRIIQCLCKCGTRRKILISRLVQHTRSCGCHIIKHGACRGGKSTAEYGIWSRIKDRCENPKNVAYKYYGGRGIKMCDKWKNSFESFIEDIGERPSKNYSIDRIDVNGNYEPGNCRWATRLQQSNNTRACNVITFNGESLNITEWANRIGIDDSTLHARLGRMPVDRALTLPPQAKFRRKS